MEYEVFRNRIAAHLGHPDHDEHYVRAICGANIGIAAHEGEFNPDSLEPRFCFGCLTQYLRREKLQLIAIKTAPFETN
jgi:hypothetical protein